MNRRKRELNAKMKGREWIDQAVWDWARANHIPPRRITLEVTRLMRDLPGVLTGLIEGLTRLLEDVFVRKLPEAMERLATILAAWEERERTAMLESKELRDASSPSRDPHAREDSDLLTRRYSMAFSSRPRFHIDTLA